MNSHLQESVVLAPNLAIYKKRKNDFTLGHSKQDDVQAKARAALRWCGYTNQHTVQHGGKRWYYLLVPDTAIQLGCSIKMLCAELTLYGEIVMSEPPKVPKAMQEKFTAIIGLAEPFCVQHLDQHYRKLIAEATAALCRKRPSPLLRGKENIWAAAIIHAVGTVNFLFDSSQTPHCRAPQIYEFFGTAASTSQNKSKEIRGMLDMSISNFKWLLPSCLENNMLVWMVQVNGFHVDVRSLPLEVQQLAYAKGLIPFVPST